ncbi:unnamed protein product [Haemonchus placei]|uniref:DUF1534 domain-containing protein n=1 Tax=Haemonchus placei TaxID=6290 RepID=A0A0N4VY85_HAEPC|nr:unnamed protein product [Haemonchus placei]
MNFVVVQWRGNFFRRSCREAIRVGIRSCRRPDRNRPFLAQAFRSLRVAVHRDCSVDTSTETLICVRRRGRISFVRLPSRDAIRMRIRSSFGSRKQFAGHPSRISDSRHRAPHLLRKNNIPQESPIVDNALRALSGRTISIKNLL